MTKFIKISYMAMCFFATSLFAEVDTPEIFMVPYEREGRLELERTQSIEELEKESQEEYQLQKVHMGDENNPTYISRRLLLNYKQASAITTLMAIYSGFFEENEKDPEKYAYWEERFEELKIIMAKRKLEEYKASYSSALQKLNLFLKKASTYSEKKMRLSPEDIKAISICSSMMYIFSQKNIIFLGNRLKNQRFYIINPFYSPEKVDKIKAEILTINHPWVYFKMHLNLYGDSEFNNLSMIYLNKAAEMDFEPAKRRLKLLETKK